MSLFQDFYDKIVRTKVFENFSMMSLMNIIGAAISFVVYPFVIRAVGAENYGHYVLAMTIVTIVAIIVSAGMDTPSAKRVVDADGDKEKLSKSLSCVAVIRVLLWALSSAIALIVLTLYDPYGIFPLVALLVFTTLEDVFFPKWYYQGVKKMKVVTVVSLSVHLIAVPFIIFFVKTPSDIFLYALIMTIVSLVSNVLSVAWLYRFDGLHFVRVSFKELVPFVKDGVPFFITEAVSNIKNSLFNFVITGVFGAAELAIYDLAQKVFKIPRVLVFNINRALFPEVVNRATPSLVRRLFRYETLIGFVAFVGLCIIGWPAIKILGGDEMMGAFPMLVILSFQLITWLIVSVYLDFVFVPAKKYFLITKNQIVAFFSSALFLVAGLFLWHNPLVIPLSFMLSSVAEIAFCHYMAKKNLLL